MGIPLGVYLSPVLLALGDHRDRPRQLPRPDRRPRGRGLEPARSPDRRRPGHHRGDRLDPRHLGHPGRPPPRRPLPPRRLATAPDRRRRPRARPWAPDRRAGGPRGDRSSPNVVDRARVAAGIEPAARPAVRRRAAQRLRLRSRSRPRHGRRRARPARRARPRGDAGRRRAGHRLRGRRRSRAGGRHRRPSTSPSA